MRGAAPRPSPSPPARASFRCNAICLHPPPHAWCTSHPFAQRVNRREALDGHSATSRRRVKAAKRYLSAAANMKSFWIDAGEAASRRSLGMTVGRLCRAIPPLADARYGMTFTPQSCTSTRIPISAKSNTATAASALRRTHPSVVGFCQDFSTPSASRTGE